MIEAACLPVLRREYLTKLFTCPAFWLVSYCRSSSCNQDLALVTEGMRVALAAQSEGNLKL